MEKQMVLRIDTDMKIKFQKIARMEAKTASEKMRELMEDYIARNDFAALIDQLLESISKKAQQRGITDADIEKAIRETRARRKERVPQ